MGGVVVRIGGASALGLALVDLDELAPVIDAHQLAAHSHLHLLARRAEAGRHRVERLAALDVMVGVDLGAASVADVVGLAVPEEQRMALLVLED